MKYIFLIFVVLTLSCAKVKGLFKQERKLSDSYNFVKTQLLKGMRLRLSGKEQEVAKIDSMLGNIGISKRTVALNMEWILDTFDVTGDKKSEIILYIPTDKEHDTGIIVIYDNNLNVLYKDIGYIMVKFAKPVYSETGFLYYTKTIGGILRHNFVGPYLGSCKLLLSVQESVNPLPLNFSTEIYSERHMRFDFYFGGYTHSEYMIQQDGEFLPLTDNLLYTLSNLPSYRETFVFLNKIVSHSYLGIITPFVSLSPDSEKILYLKSDTLKILYIDDLSNKSLYSIKGRVVDYKWRPNSTGFLLKTDDGERPHYYTIFFEKLLSYEIDMDAVFYKAASLVGSPIKYTMYPEIDQWVKDFYWEDNGKITFILNYNAGYPGKVSAKYVVKVTLEASSGIPLTVLPLSMEKAVVPLYKLTDVNWVDETQSIVKYSFKPNGEFSWRSLNSASGGVGKYELQGKNTIILYYKFDIIERPQGKGEVVKDTFNVARIERMQILTKDDGYIYLVNEDGVKLFPDKVPEKAQ